MITGIMIDVDGTMSAIDIGGRDDGLAVMQAAVGGYIEALSIPLQPPLIIWINEDGRSLGLPVNDWATMFVGATILGPVILTGGPDGIGGVRSIPELYRLLIQQGPG